MEGCGQKLFHQKYIVHTVLSVTYSLLYTCMYQNDNSKNNDSVKTRGKMLSCIISSSSVSEKSSKIHYVISIYTLHLSNYHLWL